MAHRYSVGFVGGGQVARSHAIGFANVPLFFAGADTAEMKVVAEASDALARSAAEKLGFPAWTSDWRQVTRDPAVEVVDVMTPTYLHREPAIDALEHGKAVICEKPLATTEKDAREMYEVAMRTGGRTLVGFNYRRVPAVTLAKEMIARGDLGRVNHVRSHFMEDWGGPQFPLTWRFRPQQAGAGALADLGSHAIDMVRFLVGEPLEVCGATANFVPERTVPGAEGKGKEPSEVDDVTAAVMRLEGGAIAEVGASWVATGRKVALDFEVHGDGGTVAFTMERPNELQFYSSRDGKEARGFRTIYFGPAHTYGETLIFSSPTMGTGYVDSVVAQMHDFLKSLSGGEEYAPSFRDGWRVNRIIEAVLESSRKRAWVGVGA
jgi:predicted dehydrogenase